MILYRNQLIVNLRPDHLISHGRVNRVGKVNRRGTLRKVFNISCRGKAIYIDIKEREVGLDHIHKFLGIRLILLPFQNFMQPLHFGHLCLRGLLVGASLLLILPVCGNTEFCRSVHFKGSNLNLKRHAVSSDNRSVQ